MTLDELREHARITELRSELLEESAEEAADDVMRAAAEGDELRLPFLEKRLRECENAAYLAAETAQEAREDLEEAEFEAEFPEDAAEIRAAEERAKSAGPFAGLEGKALLAAVVGQVAQKAAQERGRTGGTSVPANGNSLWEILLAKHVITPVVYTELTGVIPD